MTSIAYENQESRLRMYQIPATPSVKAAICTKVRPVPKILQAVCKA
jgi:hypothetical protein